MDKGLTAGGGMVLGTAFGMMFGIVMGHMVLGMIFGMIVGLIIGPVPLGGGVPTPPEPTGYPYSRPS